MLTSGIVLHNNASPHSSQVNKDLPEQLKLIIFNHPPYSPNLFMNMDKWAGSQAFGDDDELKYTVTRHSLDIVWNLNESKLTSDV